MIKLWGVPAFGDHFRKAEPKRKLRGSSQRDKEGESGLWGAPLFKETGCLRKKQIISCAKGAENSSQMVLEK